MKQFLERSPVLIGLVAAALIVVVAIGALTVTREDLAGGYQLDIEFIDARGLRPGDVVTVAGIRAGRVLGIDIIDDHVEARVQIESATALPEQTTAEIALRTLTGKRGIALYTGDDFTSLLEQDDVIPLERTRVATDVPTFGEAATDLLRDIDSEALNQFIASLTEVTRDQRDEVAELVSAGGDLTRIINDQEEQIRTLLRNLSDISRTLSSRDDELISIIDDLDVALGNLAARRADLQRLLAETQRGGAETADLVRDTRADLDAILTELHLDLQLVDAHQVDLAEAIAYTGDALNGFADFTFAGEIPVQWGHVFVTSLGPAGIDVLLGCGGLLDQQLDQILGPDPRTCAEQQEGPAAPSDPSTGGGGGGTTPSPLAVPLPDGARGGAAGGQPRGGAAGGQPRGGAAGGQHGPISRSAQRLPIDFGPRTLLDRLTVDAEGGAP